MNLREIDALVAEHVMGLKEVRGYTSIPCYSTDISAAWDVVEKLGCYVEYWPGYGASMKSSGRDSPDFLGKAKTAPLAICLAALKLKGIDIEKGDE